MLMKDLVPGEDYKIWRRFPAVRSYGRGANRTGSLPATKVGTVATFQGSEDGKAVFVKEHTTWDRDMMDPKRKPKLTTREIRVLARDVIGPA